MKLTAIGFGHYRSIGPEPVMLDLTKKVNVLIGANNSGKSNVIRALAHVSRSESIEASASELDAYRRNADNGFRMRVRGVVEESDKVLVGRYDELDITCEVKSRDVTAVGNPFEGLNYHNFNNIMNEYKGSYYASMPPEHEFTKVKHDVCARITQILVSQIPEVFTIPAIRKIEKGGGDYGLDGTAAIETLFKWQHPDIGEDYLKKRFDEIESLLKRLLQMGDLEIEVPHAKDKIVIRNGSLRLPLESYGTGIHELIILAIDVYSKKNVIFCIEEPEIHLHPVLQREFLRFLIEHTDNQYVLTTHSHALMAPSENINVVHVWQEDGVTKGRTVEATTDNLAVLRDLGISAGDVLQARSVIWVEGPSDRIYLNRWLELLDPALVEGIDYSIMFYGGRLLAHISMERDEFPDPDDLIPLLRINQYSAILIDSDRSKPRERLNATKQRLRVECEKEDIFCWVTDGREIENYVPTKAIEKAYYEVTEIPVSLTFAAYDHLDDALQKAFKRSRWRKKWSYNKAKVDWAKRISPHIEDVSPDLRRTLKKLVTSLKISTDNA